MNAASVLRRVTARFDPGWLLALLVTGYVILATDTWHVPTPDGPLLVPLWEALVGFTCVLWLAVRRGITPVAYIAIAAIWGILLTDSTNFTSQALRDLHIYLKAGQHFIDGQAVYLTEPLPARRPLELPIPISAPHAAGVCPPVTLSMAARRRRLARCLNRYRGVVPASVRAELALDPCGALVAAVHAGPLCRQRDGPAGGVVRGGAVRPSRGRSGRRSGLQDLQRDHDPVAHSRGPAAGARRWWRIRRVCRVSNVANGRGRSLE